ncbi:MAG: S16 family serine protease [Candidatus Aenigmatarchaeota archaeon]
MKIKILLFLIGIMVGAYIGGFFTSQTVYVYYYNYTTREVPRVPVEINASNVSFVSITVPAVDQEGNGVSTILDVQIAPGSGKTLVNVDKLLFWTDTQNSIRTAKKVAEEVTNTSLESYDIIYTITANASVIEGPSAGAALTIATIAAIQNRQINSSVMITGTINHDGTIGPVGEIIAKAQAAKEIGAELFLVPLSQSAQITYESRRYCEKIGFTQICTIEQIPQKVDVSEKVGIRVKEVRTIQEALEYFLV